MITRILNTVWKGMVFQLPRLRFAHSPILSARAAAFPACPDVPRTLRARHPHTAPQSSSLRVAGTMDYEILHASFSSPQNILFLRGQAAHIRRLSAHLEEDDT